MYKKKSYLHIFNIWVIFKFQANIFFYALVAIKLNCLRGMFSNLVHLSTKMYTFLEQACLSKLTKLWSKDKKINKCDVFNVVWYANSASKNRIMPVLLLKTAQIKTWILDLKISTLLKAVIYVYILQPYVEKKRSKLAF